jgi:hypothetical protein
MSKSYQPRRESYWTAASAQSSIFCVSTGSSTARWTVEMLRTGRRRAPRPAERPMNNAMSEARTPACFGGGGGSDRGAQDPRPGPPMSRWIWTLQRRRGGERVDRRRLWHPLLPWQVWSDQEMRRNR